MTLVRIVKNWDWPDLMRQTPGNLGIWEDIQFTLNPVDECDYLLILNRPSEDISIQCAPQHIWALIQEPPNEQFEWLHRSDKRYSRVYTSNEMLNGEQYYHSHPALPWHVDKDYDFLIECGVPTKEKDLSWVTSDKRIFAGHRKRMDFLEKIQGDLEFDLFGRGFLSIEDKWSGLAPYRYSLAIENHCNPYYWTEKLSDCFLAWTMPIYYGCTRISDYFPAEAILAIDIDDPFVIDKIQEAVESDKWQENLDAIKHARNLVLERYQLFPFMAGEIKNHEGCEYHKDCHYQPIIVSRKLRPPLTIFEQFERLVKTTLKIIKAWIKRSAHIILGRN